MDVVDSKPWQPWSWETRLQTHEVPTWSSLYSFNEHRSDGATLREIRLNGQNSEKRTASEAQVGTCPSCLENADPVSKCRDCDENLCNGCVRAHRRVKLTKDHEIVLFDTSSSRSSPLSLSSFTSSESHKENKVCGPHNTKTALLYCETCTEGVCADCSPLEHRHHDVVRLKDAIERAAIATRMLLAEANAGIISSQKSIDSSSSHLDSLAFKSELVEVEMRRFFVDVRRRLTERENDLTNEMTALIAARTKTIQQESDTYKSLLATYSRAARILNEAIEHGEPHQVLMAKELCAPEMSRAREIQDTTLSKEEDLIFVPTEGQLAQEIRRLGKVCFTGCRNIGTIGDEMKRSRCNSPQLQNTVLTPNSIAKVPFVDNSKTQPGIHPWGDLFKFKVDFNSLLNSEMDVKGSVENEVVFPKSTPSPRIIRKTAFHYAEAGRPKIVFGREGSEDGDLCRPWGVCCDAEGNIIVADRSNHRVQIFNPEGKFIKKFGTHGKKDPGCFDRPAGVAVDPNGGRIVVTDKDNHRVQVFTKDGTYIFMFGEEGNRNGQFNYPWDVALNSAGQIVISDTRNHRIQLFSREGVFLNKYGFENVSYHSKHFDSPRGLCFTTKGNVIVTDFNNHRLVVIDSRFETAKFLGVEGSAAKQFLRPQGVAVDCEGNIVVADSRNNRIQVFRENGTYLCQFGSSGSEPGQFDRPSGVCITPDGKIVVVDFGNNRVQIF